MKLTKILLVLVSGLMALACARKPEKAIVGAWIQPDGDRVIEFFAEGTVSFSAEGTSFTGNYKFLDRERVRLDFAGLGAVAGPAIMSVQFAGQDLVLTDQKGEAIRYRHASKDEATGQIAANSSNDGAARARSTMTSLHVIAIACEAYKVDHHVFPAASELASIRPLLVPVYIGADGVPLGDAWGGFIEYTSDGKTYQLRSLGSDNVRDAAPHPGQNRGYSKDIVFANGSFSQWPYGLKP